MTGGSLGSYLLARWIKSTRVVFSIDLTRTRVLGVMEGLASLRGLKLRTAFRMRFAVAGRVRTSTESVFRVASTTTASLTVEVLVSSRSKMPLCLSYPLTCYCPAER